MTATVGVVTIARGRHTHLARQRAGLVRGTTPPDLHVLVAMGDPVLDAWHPDDGVPTRVVPLHVGTEDALPLARARNLGVATALEAGVDLVIGLDVDCIPSPGLVGAYADAAASHGDAVLCGPVAYLPPAPLGGYPEDGLEQLADPHPARPAPPPGEVVRDPDGHDLFWSLSYAVTPRTWEAIGGYDEAYVGYGAEDTDLGRRARAAGVDLAWVGGALAHHQHHPVSSPPVEHVGDILRNGALFHARWGEWPMRGWLDAFVERGLVRREGDGYEGAGTTCSSSQERHR